MVSFGSDPAVLPPNIAGRVVGWARVPPLLSWKHPTLPKQWTPVLDSELGSPVRRPLQGWVFLFTDGKIREIDRRFLEVVNGPRRPL
ncbi:MAG: hypothetical protein ACREL3_02680 [Gemmatimonadales bacterium]